MKYIQIDKDEIYPVYLFKVVDDSSIKPVGTVIRVIDNKQYQALRRAEIAYENAQIRLERLYNGITD